jgi:purine-binding chemotaxis protein CheW
MSENDDDGDRMDRAERIRRMREGSSRDDEDTEEASSAKATNDADVDPTTADSGESTAESTQPEAHDESESDDTAEGKTHDEFHQDDATSESGPGGDEWVSGADKMQEDNEDETDEVDQEGEPEATVPETASLDTQADEPAVSDTESDISAPLPGSDQLEDALDEQGEESETEAVAPDEVAGADTGTGSEMLDEEVYEEETRVLEFQLGDEYYCLDIEYIEEIVKEETITRVPNTPAFVEGVVDLRGQITTILNPKETIEKDETTPGDLIIVFDSDSFEDQGHVGWVVDDVRQVSPITDNEVSEPPVDEAYINGVIDRGDDEQFVIWTSPEMAMEEAE